MENIRFKIGEKEHTAVMRNPKTNKVMLVIEINEHNVFTSEKGNTYVTLSAINCKEVKDNQTHFVKVPGKFDKEKNETTGLETIVGNIIHVEQKEVEPNIQTANDEDAKVLPF